MTAIIKSLELCLVFRGISLLFIYRYDKLGLGGKAVEAVELFRVGFRGFVGIRSHEKEVFYVLCSCYVYFFGYLAAFDRTKALGDMGTLGIIVRSIVNSAF